jgi:hypothetical protein
LAQADGGDEVYDENFVKGFPAWTDKKYSTCKELVPGKKTQVIMSDVMSA